MLSGPEPELIPSPLSRSVEHDGTRLTVNIMRLATEPGWSLEVVNDQGTSTVWEELFATDREADAAFRRALAAEGINSFVGE